MHEEIKLKGERRNIRVSLDGTEQVLHRFDTVVLPGLTGNIEKDMETISRYLKNSKKKLKVVYDGNELRGDI